MGAKDVLHHLRGAGFIITLAEGGGIRVAPSKLLTDAHRQAIRDNRAELLALLFVAPAVDPDRWCWPHSEAMNGAELALFAKRAQQFTRIGIGVDDAEALADRLVIRDRTRDDQRTCPECSHFSPGRCSAYPRAGLRSSDLSRDLTMSLQRCPGFVS